jgi:CII-binding regulator of phage lambda lysogenization HflD
MSVAVQKKKVKLEDLEELVSALEKIYLDEEEELGKKAQMDGKP